MSGGRCGGEVRRRRGPGAALHRAHLPRPGPGRRMRIGIPREVKDGEHRVALSPAGIRGLARVVVEPGAGQGVGFSDERLPRGRRDARRSRGNASSSSRSRSCRKRNTASRGRARPCSASSTSAPTRAARRRARLGATFIAFETVGQAERPLPILSPMSAIAGRLAVQVGAWCLQKQNGGSGVLLPGLEGIAAGKVVIIGAGNVGANALARRPRPRRRTSPCSPRSEKPRLKARYPRAVFRTGPLGSRGRRPRHRRRADPGQMSPKLITADHAARHAAGLGAGRRRHRPGRHRGNFAADLAQRADLRRGRRGALLRAEHARRLPRAPRASRWSARSCPLYGRS